MRSVFILVMTVPLLGISGFASDEPQVQTEAAVVRRITEAIRANPGKWQLTDVQKTAESHAYSSSWIRRSDSTSNKEKSIKPIIIHMVMTFWPSRNRAIETFKWMTTPSLVTSEMKKFEPQYKDIDESCGWDGLPPNGSATIYIRRDATTTSISAPTSDEAREFAAIVADQLASN